MRESETRPEPCTQILPPAAAGILVLVTGCCRGPLELPPSSLDSRGEVVSQDEKAVKFHVTRGQVDLVGFSRRVSIYRAADGAQTWTPIGRNVMCPCRADCHPTRGER